MRRAVVMFSLVAHRARPTHTNDAGGDIDHGSPAPITRRLPNQSRVWSDKRAKPFDEWYEKLNKE